jgi:hypothetical protein
MKKLYFLVVLAISFATQAQIVNIPDANFKAKLLSASASNQIAGICNSQPCVSGTTALTYIPIDINGDNEIQVSECQAVEFLNLNLSNITDLTGIEEFTNLKNLNCSGNNLTNINVSALTNLNEFRCENSQLTSLNVSGCISLTNLWIENNLLTSIDISSLTNLAHLYCGNNQLSSLDFTNLQNLEVLFCQNNNLTSLDLSQNTNLWALWCNNNQLEYLNLKNGYSSEGYAEFFIHNNPLQYVCVDLVEINFVQQHIDSMALSNTCSVNTYCTFTPGGNFYTIEGNTKLDSNVNGCDVNDFNYPNLKFSITDGTTSGSLISNTSGNYSIPVQAGSYTITPIIENPTYFNISPTSFVANFPTQTSPLMQDFCITANGVHNDVEIVYIHTSPAKSGFATTYSIIYKNKGNQVENGTITLDFNDAVLDFLGSYPISPSQTPNSLVWNYTNLLPYEMRWINLGFDLNASSDIPALNIGDVLNYTASITPLTTDEVVSDNTSTLNQTVVASYDPNDKTCIEGTTVGPDMIGQFVHYVIRFENTGTYPAENVVVKDLIDLAKFDVNTLIPLHSSHDFVTRIAGNKVEFIFEGINLPFDDANNDGYVAFKIKTKSNLVVGDTFSNNANIYFDYNFPIMTNTFTTTIQVLKVKDFEFGTHFTLYPNPVKDVFNLHSKDNTTINSIEIYNTLGQVVLAVPNAVSIVDVSNLQSGNYLVKVNTDLGVSNTKFIKE